jgi:hypothetical protein
MRPRRLTPVVAALIIAASCSSRDATPDGAPSEATVRDSTPPAPTVPWFDGTEPLLLAPAEGAGHALVVSADSMAPDPEDGDLPQIATVIRLDGSMDTSRVRLGSSAEGCVEALLTPAPTMGWGVGFIGRAPAPLHVDSLRAMSPQDSAALAPILFRLASTVPNAPGGRFSGLPFTLTDVWRVRLPDGVTLIVATTKRQINQEDSPLEERTLIIARPDGGDYSLVHSARSSGPEETVEGTELLAAVSFSAGQTLLVMTHDYGEEASYSILEPAGPRAWKVRWTSRRFSC